MTTTKKTNFEPIAQDWKIPADLVDHQLAFLDDLEAQKKSAGIDFYRFEALLVNKDLYTAYLLARIAFLDGMTVTMDKILPFQR